MNNDDLQYPEFVANRRHGRSIQKVPFVYQREGETWEQFCERERRVSDALHNTPPMLEKKPIGGILLAVAIGIMLWVAIWELFR